MTDVLSFSSTLAGSLSLYRSRRSPHGHALARVPRPRPPGSQPRDDVLHLAPGCHRWVGTTEREAVLRAAKAAPHPDHKDGVGCLGTLDLVLVARVEVREDVVVLELGRSDW